MNGKRIIGLILMAVAVVIFLLITNSIIFVFLDPELKEWISTSAIGFIMLYVLTFFLFGFGRKWYRNNEEEERADILDTSDILRTSESSISKNTFRMKSGGFKEVRSGMIKRTIPIGILAVGAGLTISFFKSSSSGDFDWNLLLIMIPISLLAIGYGVKQGIDRQRQIFESYVLSINETNIERKAFNTPDIMIAKLNINAIIKNNDGSFLIKSDSSKDIIGIHAQIERKDELEKMLEDIHPVTNEAPKSLIEKYQMVLTILPMVLMVVTFLSTNKWMVGIAGTLVLITMGYSFFEIQRNKNIDEKTKKGSWWLLLVVFAVLGTMYSKIVMM